MTQPQLLPQNRTPFETAVEETNAARYPLPVDLVKSVWQPDNCPVDLLPYLAWGLSVDIWDNDWPELKKRQVCRDALKLHRLKTTPAGIKAHLALADTTVKRVVRPPARQQLRGAVTEAARLAWLDTLPQIRIYPFNTKSTAKHRLFYTGPGVHRQFHGFRRSIAQAIGVIAEPPNGVLAGNAILPRADGFTVTGYSRSTRGPSLYGRKATYYKDGTETDITLSGDVVPPISRVFMSTVANKRAFLGHGFYGRQFPTATTAQNGVITINALDDAHTFAVAASIDPVDVKPKRIAQQRTAPAKRSFGGRFHNGTFLRSSYGPRLIYDRIALNDPTKMVARRKVLAWHGHGRFGIDPYTAEIRVSVPMQRKKRISGAWHGVGFRRASDMAPLDKAIQAVRVSKAFRDTILIDTQNYERVKFGGGLRFGDFTFGQIIEVN